MQEKEQYWTNVNWWSQKLLCWMFLEVLISDGIAAMTLPVPLDRVSTSEILMPLFLRTWQTWLVIHLKMFFLQEEVFVAPSSHLSRPTGLHFGNKNAALTKIREYMENLARKEWCLYGALPRQRQQRPDLPGYIRLNCLKFRISDH